MTEEVLVGLLGSEGLSFLTVDFFVQEVEEGSDRHVFVVSLLVRHEPLEHFLESVLLALLVRHIVAEGGLLVELREGVGCLFE